eukprot:CAMPEP_0116113992 /NCGR_PEP_ID=MMETSP0327-20121206/19790_1 /TAXON_ID=44447 /ORGANISM="Pseudo-nitzschia delicatissima, Strain B596" /LENGTH=533 /DNA_ID=CAMNT_0003607359 /DNA_START=278 /DNA_END=1876 /DNA_ORIENTATION=-
MNQQQHNKPQSLRSHKYLRSRGRRLYSELFVEEDEIPIGNSDQIDPLWSLSGTFTTSNHAKHIDLYNSSDANTPRFPEHDYTTPPLPALPVEEQQQEYGSFFFTTLLPLLGFCFLIALCRCSGGGAPGPEYHRGHQIRENALRIWAMQRRKAKRREATPEERLAKIKSRVCTQKVVSKDPKTDRCQLGDVDAPLQQEDASTQLESKQSTDTADTLPLEFDENCNSRDEMPMESASNHIDNFDDDDEDVCPICLDGFDVGDTVMFARDLSCAHVFHEECLLPWLLERRENECPSCREALVDEEPESELDEDGSKNETESNRNNGTDCGSCHISNTGNEASEDRLVDLEKGDAPLNDTTTYFIVKGRVVAETKHSIMEHSFESECNTATTDGSSFHDYEQSCDASTKTNSLLRNRQLQRPRALSVTYTDNNTSDLSIPLPLVRISQSLPANFIQSRLSKHSKCCDNCRSSISSEKESSTSSNLQLYDDENRQSQFPGLHTRFYDSPSIDDSSDEDDAICRMVHGHNYLAGPKNAS